MISVNECTHFKYEFQLLQLSKIKISINLYTASLYHGGCISINTLSDVILHQSQKYDIQSFQRNN